MKHGPSLLCPPRGPGLAVALILALALLPAPASAQALTTAAARLPVSAPPALAAAVRSLERELSADVTRDSVGSLAAAIFVGGEVVWRGAYGWRDRASGTLGGPGTLYRVGSITKPVTALLLLRLVEEGVVELDESVATHLPELRALEESNGPSRDRAITFRDLATHVSGLAREPDSPRFTRGLFREWKRKAVAAIPETRRLSAPGERYRYSNIGYALLGFALERAAGRPYEILADSLVLRPLGMERTVFVVTDDRRRLATGYVNLPGDSADPRVPRAEHGGRGYRVPSGGLYSTVDDLARLGMALTGAVPLVADTLRALLFEGGHGHVNGNGDGDPDGDSPEDRGARYGLGLQLLDFGAFVLAGHSGTVPGYTAYLLVDPELSTGVVLLRNYNHGDTNLGAAATRLLLRLRDSSVP